MMQPAERPLPTRAPLSLLRVALFLVYVAASPLLGGCATLGYAGDATSVSLAEVEREPGWLAVEGVEPLRQPTDHACGITALDMVMRYHGRSVPADVRNRVGTETRWSAGQLREAARDLGMLAFVVEGSVDDLVHELRAGRPVIAGTAKPTVTGEHVAHFEVVVGVHADAKKVATIDPAVGPRQNSFEGFLEEWLATGSVLLVVLPQDDLRAGTAHAENPERKESSYVHLQTLGRLHADVARRDGLRLGPHRAGLRRDRGRGNGRGG